MARSTSPYDSIAVSPKSSPGSYPIEGLRLFANSARHLSAKAQIRATLLNLIPAPVAKAVLGLGWRYVPAANAGFAKAFTTIIDTHVTTIVSCAFLFAFGSTAVKGFAITLVIGLIANIFTAVFISKFIFDWELAGNRQATTLSI